VIDRPPAQGPAQASFPPETATPPPPPVAPRRGLYLGPLKITLPVVLVTLALLGSAAFIVYVTFRVEDEQIPLLAAGFGVMGACFAAIAIGTLVEMWRAASRARGGRALGLAIVGGIAGLIAIGCFTFTALATMVWNT
jgi:Na+-transporting NADH:ubiquinone oxidoreductase subunit NqrE